MSEESLDFDTRYDIIDDVTPRHSMLSGHYKKSFAYFTLRERLPETLTTILDGLTRDKDELVERYSEEAREELKKVIGLISKLKYQLQTDKKMEPFSGSEPDQAIWNEFLSKLPAIYKSFFTACWLHAECYIYRKVSSFFESTTHLKEFDYFEKKKHNAMTISEDAMISMVQSISDMKHDYTMFQRLVKLNLWGNRCDLSMTSGKDVKPHCLTLEKIDMFDTNLLINDIETIWECLTTANPNEPILVEFIMDNAGFELFTDFLLAGYLIETGLATTVRFNVKALPWFVSDVTPRDFHWSLKYLREHKSPFLNVFGKKWTQFLSEGKFELAPVDYFWTSPYEYYRMQDVNIDLYNKLSNATLVIFKGDLNYRKLLGDFSWDLTDDFVTCLRGFIPTNLCTLRTIKADLLCGLPGGIAKELTKKDANWMTSGEYGVIQMAKVSKCGCTKD